MGDGIPITVSMTVGRYRLYKILQLNAIVKHIITRISIQTAGLAFGDTSLCRPTYRVRGRA